MGVYLDDRKENGNYYLGIRVGGFRTSGAPFLVGPHNKDSRTLGSMFRFPCFWQSPHRTLSLCKAAIVRHFNHLSKADGR